VTDRLAAERSAQRLPPEHIENDAVLARVAALVVGERDANGGAPGSKSAGVPSSVPKRETSHGESKS
jgi:hypothetical protein